MDKFLQVLKDWRMYIVFVTFLIFILIVPSETIASIQSWIGGFSVVNIYAVRDAQLGFSSMFTAANDAVAIRNLLVPLTLLVLLCMTHPKILLFVVLVPLMTIKVIFVRNFLLLLLLLSPFFERSDFRWD